MPYADSVAKKTNVLTLATNFFVNSGAPVETISKSHTLLNLFLGMGKSYKVDGFGQKYRFPKVAKSSGAKIQVNVQGKVIPSRTLTRDSSFQVTPVTDPNGLFAMEFDYASKIQTYDFPGMDFRRISGKEALHGLVKSYEGAADEGFFQDRALDLFATTVTTDYGAPSSGKFGSIDYAVSSGLAADGEAANAVYGTLDRSVAENDPFRALIADGTAHAGFGVMSKQKLRVIQQRVRDNGGSADILVVNSMILTGWFNTFGESTNVRTVYEDQLMKLGSAYIYYNGTLIVGDKDCDPTRGYLLSMESWLLFWKGMENPASDLASVAENGAYYLGEREDLYRVKRIWDMQLLMLRGNQNLKIKGLQPTPDA